MATVNDAFKEISDLLSRHLSSMTENERITLVRRLVVEITKREEEELGSNSG